MTNITGQQETINALIQMIDDYFISDFDYELTFEDGAKLYKSMVADGFIVNDEFNWDDEFNLNYHASTILADDIRRVAE